MPNDYSAGFDPSTVRRQDWAALSGGAALLLWGARRRSVPGLLLTLAAVPLIYRGATGQWPPLPWPSSSSDDTRVALGGERGVHVREAIQLERPVADVFRSWRRLADLPRFMSHLERVTEEPDGRSHWVAKGPGGMRVEWDAELINEVENQVIGWRSLPGSDLVTAGSVNFDRVRGGERTQVTVHLQYAPPGKAGAFLAALFGREPSQTIREDLRRFKQLMEAGDTGRTSSPAETAR